MTLSEIKERFDFEVSRQETMAQDLERITEQERIQRNRYKNKNKAAELAADAHRIQKEIAQSETEAQQLDALRNAIILRAAAYILKTTEGA